MRREGCALVGLRDYLCLVTLCSHIPCFKVGVIGAHGATVCRAFSSQLAASPKKFVRQLR